MTQHPYRIPVSVKGIVFENNQVWLRKNERDEWELPGGKVDRSESLEAALVREIAEELGIKIEVANLVGVHLRKVPESIDEEDGVLIITYLCKFIERVGETERVGEAGLAEFKQFTRSEISSLNMPDFFKDAIDRSLDSASLHSR